MKNISTQHLYRSEKKERIQGTSRQVWHGVIFKRNIITCFLLFMKIYFIIIIKFLNVNFTKLYVFFLSNLTGRCTNTSNVSAVSAAISPSVQMCSGRGIVPLPEHADQIFQHVRSTEACCEIGFCRTGSCTHRPKVVWFLLSWLISANIRPVCLTQEAVMMVLMLSIWK